MNGIFKLGGLDDYLQKIAQAGGDIDGATAKAVDAGADVALAGMRRRVRKKTHNLEQHISKSEVMQSGNQFTSEIGLLDLGAPLARYGKRKFKRARTRHVKRARYNVYPREFLYGVVQEFGSTTMAAQPYIRPTMDEDAGKIRAAERNSLKADGML